MSAIAPDATTILSETSPCPDDDAVRTLLGTAAGKNLQVGPEHLLGAVVGRPFRTGTTGSNVLIDRFALEHAVLHFVDISAIIILKANWVSRPEFLSKVLMTIA